MSPVFDHAPPRERPRVLVVQTAFLGDIVLTTPLLRELRRRLPNARICMVTTATGRDAVGSLSYVDEWLVLDKRWHSEGRRSYRGLLLELLRTRFDVAVAAHRSVRTGVIVRLSGAPTRIGFVGAPGAWAYSHRVGWESRCHAARRYLELSLPLGGDPAAADALPHLTVDPAADSLVADRLRQLGLGTDDDLMCVAPGSVWPTKRWLPEGFGKVIEAAHARGLRPLLVGTAVELELCRAVARKAGTPVPILAGETTVQQLVALAARSRLVVANDSGTAHVAAAVGTPLLSIFGSTTPDLGYAPLGPHTRIVERRGLSCRPCGRHGARACPLDHFRCMRELEPRAVVDAMDDLLASTGERPLPRRLDSVGA